MSAAAPPTPHVSDPAASFLISRLASPIGQLLIVHDDAGRLRALDFHDHEPRLLRLLQRHYRDATLTPAPLPAHLATPLQAYFAGDATALAEVAVETSGTPFQRRVWAALRAIPAGTTSSYGQLARAIGAPGASRAVGLANGANPVGIVVPCHRVIGADGSLTGFGGGLARKQWLLRHEGAAFREELALEG